MNQNQLDTRLQGGSVVSGIVAPRLRYLMELQCRELEISFSRYISASLDATLRDSSSDNYLNDYLWHDDPAIRLYRLATSRADLLSHSERLLWRSILKDSRVYRENGILCPDKISEQWQRLIVGF